MNKNLFKKLFSIEKKGERIIMNFMFFKFKFKKHISNYELFSKLETIIKMQATIIDNESKFFKMYTPHKEKPVLPFLSIHLVDKCNNNCNSCSHFCTLADEFVLDLDDYKHQISILAQKFLIREIDLMGGEPLLHPKINKIFDITREILPNAFICLHTNAILLPKMQQNFWESCRKNKIAFKITKYPTIKDFNALIDLCLENSIFIAAIINGMKFLHWMDLEGRGNVDENFHACKSKFGHCYILRNYNLYTCPTACYMDLYNEYFNKNMPVERGIDIIKSTTDEILSYLNTPIENCKYCRNVMKLKPHSWRKSSRNSDEWDDERFLKSEQVCE